MVWKRWFLWRVVVLVEQAGPRLVSAGFGDGVAGEADQFLLMLVDKERIIPWHRPESKPQCLLKTSNASLFSRHVCVHVNRGKSAIPRVWEKVFRYSSYLNWTALQIFPRSFFYTQCWKTNNSFLIWQQNDFDGQKVGCGPWLCGQLTGDLMSDRPFKQLRLTLISKSPTWSSITTPHNPVCSVPSHSYAVRPLNKTHMLQNYQFSTLPASENWKILPPWLDLKCKCLFADEDIHFPQKDGQWNFRVSHLMSFWNAWDRPQRESTLERALEAFH